MDEFYMESMAETRQSVVVMSPVTRLSVTLTIIAI